MTKETKKNEEDDEKVTEKCEEDDECEQEDEAYKEKCGEVIDEEYEQRNLKKRKMKRNVMKYEEQCRQEFNQTYYNESVAVPIIAPGIPLPPQPVLTRWGTWLDAVNYYAEHYGKIMEVLEDILFIDSNFKIVSKSIILLESSKLQLSEAHNIVNKVSQTVIQNNNSLISEKVKCHDKTSEVGVQVTIGGGSLCSRSKVCEKFLQERTQKAAEIDPVFYRSPAMKLEEWKSAGYEP
ncbi:hypothetical protein ANN_02047 [Periplaneta americana]|uniref:Uncharacterized protein n=1 Tax=Periplaneta americana TaxID=6978 RepID=A0ABQ8TYM9_PERAM|nr:hypothetical protein ANN_02047 [Periplaneta americana]